MDIGNYERIDREQRQRITTPEIAAMQSAALDERSRHRDAHKLSTVFLLQILFSLFVTAAIVLVSNGYIGDASETLPCDVAEDAATRTLSDICRRWFDEKDISGIFEFGGAAPSKNDSDSDQTSNSDDLEEPSDEQDSAAATLKYQKLSTENGYLSLSLRSTKRAELSGALEIPATATLAPIATTAGALSPIKSWDKTSVNSGFGYRIHPISGKLDFHTGLDIPANYGDAICAVLPGLVVETGYSDIFGNYVILEHTSGTRTRYCHCSSIAICDGTRVRAGETIAYAGSTGVSTGAHLHLDLIVDGLYSNPKWLFHTPFYTAG